MMRLETVGASTQAPGRSRYDCVVVGGGHNGLVCATYLARSGRSVLVLEAAQEVGGAAVTREFAPGFRASACAHLLYSMSHEILKDLALEDHGLRFATRGMSTVALSEAGEPMLIGSRDAAAYSSYSALLNRLAKALNPVLESVPPRLGTDSWADRRSLLQLGWRVRRLGKRDMRELLRIGGMNVYDLLQEHFCDPLLQGALGIDAVLGTNFGPRSPGSVFTLLHRLAGAAAAGSAGAGAGASAAERLAPADGAAISLAQPQGGLGSLSQALASSATRAGAEIRTGSAVRRVVVRDHRAAGVQLLSGDVIDAGVVISNVDPQTTFLRLLGPEHLDAGFTRRVSNLRTHGLTAKLHLALAELPQFKGVAAEARGGRLLIAPSLDYLERAFNHSKYGEFSAAPALEITLPSMTDPTMAPEGKHVLSAIVQYAPYSLKGGWGTARREFTEVVIDTIEQYAPGLRESIISTQLLTPADIEREFRITGGHWHHAELALDQFFMMRPVAGAAQYETPVEGLYLCGAGCHPGGGVMGIAGRNAARRVLEQAA
jgi:phytoene dehydrogenase-like protein